MVAGGGIVRGVKAHRKDGNQTEIERDLRSLGFAVHSTHALGSGFPDLVIGDYHFNFLVEVKPTAKAKLTADEDEWHRRWEGQVNTCISTRDVLLQMGEWARVNHAYLNAIEDHCRFALAAYDKSIADAAAEAAQPSQEEETDDAGNDQG